MKIASTTPTRCSGCGGQYARRTHVDFESAWDGPPVDTENPRAGYVAWVVLCSDCIRSAHDLLPEQRSRIERLESQRDQIAHRLREQGEYVRQLEATVAAKRRSQPKPKPQEVAA